MRCGMHKNPEHAQLTSILEDGKTDFETRLMTGGIKGASVSSSKDNDQNAHPMNVRLMH